MEAQRLPCPTIERGQQHLLPEQHASLQQFFQERLAALSSCAPINEQEAETHLAHAYRVLGLAAPRIRWFDSPLAFLVAYALQWVSNSYGTKLGKNIERQLENLAENVLLGIWEAASDTLWEQVESARPDSSAWDSIGITIWMRMDEEIREKRSWEDEAWIDIGWGIGTLSESERNHTWQRAEDSIRSHRLWEDGVQDIIRAYREESRLACYRFFHEACEDNALIHLARLNEMVSGYRLGESEAWLIRKPVRLERDEQGRLHSVDGMCIQYPDGLGFYAWHGVRCPELFIRGKITRTDWLREENLERRRVIEERLGPEQFIALLGERCIHHSKRGMLIELDLPGDPERVAHYLKVRDPSTNRRYYLRVPPSITNADEAAAWTFGLDTDTYQPGQET